MTIYAIPGLGADERVFQYLSLPVVPIRWVAPAKHEPLTKYVQRLTSQIDINQPFILLGVSFGGMVAVEMNKFVHPEKTIIISSAATKHELPLIIRALSKTGIIKVLPAFMLKPPAIMANYLFGLKRKKTRKLLSAILKDTPVDFLHWAVNKIAGWKNVDIPPNLIRIHGDRDKLLKMQSNVNYEVIKGGGHLMIVEEAHEVEAILKKHLTLEAR